MEKKPIDLGEILDSETAGRIAERLGGALSETEERVWGGDFVASGDGKSPPRPAPPPPTPI